MKFVVTQCSIENQNEGVRTKEEEEEEEKNDVDLNAYQSIGKWTPHKSSVGFNGLIQSDSHKCVKFG